MLDVAIRTFNGLLLGCWKPGISTKDQNLSFLSDIGLKGHDFSDALGKCRNISVIHIEKL